MASSASFAEETTLFSKQDALSGGDSSSRRMPTEEGASIHLDLQVSLEGYHDDLILTLAQKAAGIIGVKIHSYLGFEGLTHYFETEPPPDSPGTAVHLSVSGDLMERVPVRLLLPKRQGFDYFGEEEIEYTTILELAYDELPMGPSSSERERDPLDPITKTLDDGNPLFSILKEKEQEGGSAATEDAEPLDASSPAGSFLEDGEPFSIPELHLDIVNEEAMQEIRGLA